MPVSRTDRVGGKAFDRNPVYGGGSGSSSGSEILINSNGSNGAAVGSSDFIHASVDQRLPILIDTRKPTTLICLTMTRALS
jgi:hypothetical protein